MLLERAVVGLLRICIRMIRREKMVSLVSYFKSFCIFFFFRKEEASEVRKEEKKWYERLEKKKNSEKKGKIERRM